MLDVSAAFMTGTGVLELDITNTSDVATLQEAGGDVAIRDAANNAIDIDVDGGGPMPVAWSDVKEIIVRGDAVLDQQVVFDTQLTLSGSLEVEDSIELAVLTDSINSGAAITFGSDVDLAGDILLVSTDLTFGGTVDSLVNTSHSLTIDATGSVSFNGNIGEHAQLDGLNILRADGGVTFGDASPVQLISSSGSISIGSANAIGGTGVVVNGGTNATLQITTTNKDVMINGATKLESGLSIDTGNRGGDIIFSPDSPIDSTAGESNDLTLDAGMGSVFLNQNIGDNEAVGRLLVTRAAGGVTFGATGPVTNVYAANGIDLGTGNDVIAGTGIVLNGGASTLTLQTNGASIRLNGVTTLGSDVLFDTGPGVGDIMLTNDTPVDSSAGEFNDLMFNAGAGSVFINEDLGRTNRLGSLTVMTAGGGVVFGQATTELPNADAGPVEVINSDGEIVIGVGANAIGGAGVVFRGGAVARATITTTGDDVLVNGATTLGTDLTVRTSGGNLTFTNGSTVDSVPSSTSSLIVELDDGALFFNADIGSTTPLGRLTVVSAKAGVTFGDTAPVNLVRTRQPIDIGVGSNVIEGTGITLNGGGSSQLIATSNANIRLNGAVHAQSDISIDTGDGGGSITLTSSATIDSDDGPGSATTLERNSVVLDAGNGTVLIDANLGGQQRLGSLIVERAAGGVVIGGTGAVSRIAADGPINFGSVAEIAGGIALDGGNGGLRIETFAEDISFNGPVELRSDVVIDTGAGGGDVSFAVAATLDSQAGEANDLSIALGTGNLSLNAAVGTMNPLDELRIVSAMNVIAQSDVNVARIVQQAGSGTTLFNGAINTTDATLAGLDLTGGAFVFNGPVAATGNGRVSIVHSGLLDINPAAAMRIDGAFIESGTGSVELAASIITSGDAIRFGSPVLLTDGAAGDVLLDTTAAGSATGAAIVFDRTLNAQSVGSETLSLNAGTSGDVAFNDSIGNASRVGQLQIIAANDVTFAGSVVTTNVVQDSGRGTTRFNGTVNADSAISKAIDVNTANVSFQNAVATTGDGRVELTVGGTLDLASAAELNLSGSFLQDGGGEVRTAADITTSDDDITFTDAVILQASVRFDTGPGAGNLLFASTLDGTNDCQEDITLALGTGNARFQQAVGSSVGLGDVRVESAADVRFESSLLANSITQIAGTGETRFDGPVTIKSAAGFDLTTASVTINNTLDTTASAGPIRIAATNNITINSAVSVGNATVTLTAGDDISLGGNATITTSGATVTGGAVLMSDGAVIDAGSGVIDIIAEDNIQLGRLLTTTLVRLTSTGGAIVDGGDFGGADIVADRLALRSSTGVGTANPIDTSVNTIAATNQGAGGVRLTNATGRPLTIGAVDGLSGIMNGPSGAPAKLGGEVEIIHVGAINVQAAILNHGGSHTIVRAELPGDLTLDAPIQNRGGDGWIFLFSGGDLVINHSLPEPQAEVSVENEGAIRGEARGNVIIDNSDTEYVIIRTHAERFPNTGAIPTLSAKFADPARYPPPSDTAFYLELEAELRAIRESISAQATNFAPLFDIEPVDQGGSDVDANGRGIVKITIGDGVHLETNWHFTIDWGDGTIESYTIPGNPQASLTFLNANGLNTNRFPDLSNTPRIDSGVGGQPGVYYVHHKYLTPPNPNDPAAPIPISATLRYDAREEGEQSLDLTRPTDGSSIFNGIRFFQNGTQPIQSVDNDILTNPGQGAFGFIKVVESVIVPVESRQVVTVFVTANATTTSAATRTTFEFTAASFEADVTEEYRLFMRVVDDVLARAQQAESGVRSPTAGEGTQEYPLPLELLDDPLSIFRERRFPNGHYRIYLEEIRTGRVRLILDVHIYEGRVVPENFREGAAERQPGSDDSSQLKFDNDPLAVSAMDDTEIPLAAKIERATPNADINANAAVPGRSSLFAPLAAAALPWRARVRKALRSETRSISRTSLRLRRHG